MKKDRKPPPMRRVTAWDPEDVALVAGLGLLEDVTGEDILWLIHRSGKRRTGKLAGIVTPKSQTRTFAQWVGVGDDLWDDHRWRGCLLMRYSRGDAPAISFLTDDWKLKLEVAANEFLGSGGPRPLTSDHLEASVSQSIPHQLLNDAYFRLGFEYLEALITKQWSESHRLNQPLSLSGLFRRVFERADRDNPPELRHYKDDRHMLLIGLPGGHITETLGKVCYYLLLLEHQGTYLELEVPKGLASIWPGRTNLDFMKQGDEFATVCTLYAEGLGVPRGEFLETRMAYIAAMLNHTQEARRETHQTIFWAARILREIAPEVFKEYEKWVRQFKSFTVKRAELLKSRESVSPPTLWAVIGPPRSSLEHDPLLNCVLHSLVLDGDNRLKKLTPQGRPPNRVEGLTIGFAVHKFKSLKLAKDKPTARAILTKKGSKASPRVQASAQLANDHSVYSYVAPLVTAILSTGTWSYTPEEIRENWRHYKDNKDVKLMQSNISRTFADAAWVKRRH